MADRNGNQKLLEASAIGWMFPLSIGIGFLIGYGLDRWLHFWPWLTVIFSVLGIAAAFVNLFRMSGSG